MKSDVQEGLVSPKVNLPSAATIRKGKWTMTAQGRERYFATGRFRAGCPSVHSATPRGKPLSSRRG